ncbi:MAG: murein biosynthesis integral membrane protein MurJ [Anaerolineales bacterium]
MNKLSHLTRTSLLLGFFFLLDKILAFGRSIIIARQFQVSNLDAFNAANNLPDLLFALISGGALAMAFIPLLSEYLTKKDRAAAWDLFSRVVNLGFTVTASVSLIIAIFADPIVHYGIAPGFSPEKQALVAQLMRLDLAATLIFSISGLVMAGLQANQSFLLPAIAPILYNVGMIAGALVFSPATPYQLGPITLPALGLGVYGLAYGVILGAALHLLIQIPGLIKYQFRWTPSLDIRNSGLIQALKLMAPRLLTMFGIQLMFILRDNFASRLEVGAVSTLTYGWMIMQVPETLLGTAIATALLPSLAEYAARGDWTTFRNTIDKALRVMLALTLPAAAVMAAGMHPLVQTAFSKFGAAGIDLLTLTSRVYMLTLAGYTVQETLARSFYARKEPLMPLWGVLVRLAVYVVIGICGVTVFSAVGAPVIAAAELSISVEAVFMLIMLNRRLKDTPPIRPLTAIGKGLVAALLSGALAYGLAVYLPGSAFITALVGMAAGGLLAVALVWSEAKQLFRL